MVASKQHIDHYLLSDSLIFLDMYLIHLGLGGVLVVYGEYYNLEEIDRFIVVVWS